jgi:hypothetical protein
MAPRRFLLAGPERRGRRYRSGEAAVVSWRSAIERAVEEIVGRERAKRFF